MTAPHRSLKGDHVRLVGGLEEDHLLARTSQGGSNALLLFGDARLVIVLKEGDCLKGLGEIHHLAGPDVLPTAPELGIRIEHIPMPGTSQGRRFGLNCFGQVSKGNLAPLISPAPTETSSLRCYAGANGTSKSVECFN